MPRYISPRMEITIPGRPLTSGKPQNGDCFRGRDAYINLIKLSTKMAMKEWGWEKTTDPIFVVIGIYFGIHDKNMSKKQIREKCASQCVANKTPLAVKFTDNVVKALKGIAYVYESQIVGILTIKKYDLRERVEILIGKPSNLKEFEHDIRNA